MDVFGYLDLRLGLMVLAAAFLSALAALQLVVRLAPPRRVALAPLDASGNATAFLFEGDRLVDATHDARHLLARGPGRMKDLPRLAATLAPRFPDLAERLSRLGPGEALELVSRDGQAVLGVESRASLTRVVISARGGGDGPPPDALSIAAMEDELGDLRATIDAAPVLIWKEDAEGAVRWANAAYIALALRAEPGSETLPWPLPRLFPAEAESDAGRLRLQLPVDGGGAPESLHFEAARREVGGMTMVFATPADRLAKAEGQHRQFMQTLTKTFAHLPIGLALFDRDRRLAVFNPALTELSGLPPLFLSRQPTLFDFLDGLREARRMPEPKDYRDWRRRIVEMEQAAANATHIETWNLPDGDTIRITGRPHPDGAIAFLFEDVTSEVSLSRRFHSQLEILQAAVDSMPEAVAVFGPSRALVLSNAAYDTLWEDERADTLAPTTLTEALARWRAAARPSPAWDEIAAFAARPEPRGGWARELHMADGRGLTCRVAGLPGGATLVGFALHAPDARRLSPVSAAAEPPAPAPGTASAAAP